MKLNALLDVAQKPTGSAVLTTDTVLQLLMTAQPSNCPVYSQKRLRRLKTVPPELNAQPDVAHIQAGTAAQTTETALLLLMTVQTSDYPIYSQ